MKIKKLISLFCLMAVFTGCLFMFGCTTDKATEQAIKTIDVSNISVSLLGAKAVYGEDEHNRPYALEKIQATVEPSNAVNKDVVYSVAWSVGAERSSENVSDYITVVQDSEYSLGASVFCWKAFGDDEIIITCESVQTGVRGTTTVKFVGFVDDISIDLLDWSDSSDEFNKVYATKTGDFYNCFVGTAYTICVDLNNIFGVVGSSDIEVSFRLVDEEGDIVKLYYAEVEEANDIVYHFDYTNAFLRDFDLNKFVTFDISEEEEFGYDFEYFFRLKKSLLYTKGGYNSYYVSEEESSDGLDHTYRAILDGMYDDEFMYEDGYADYISYNVDVLMNSHIEITVKDKITGSYDIIELLPVETVDRIVMSVGELLF